MIDRCNEKYHLAVPKVSKQNIYKFIKFYQNPKKSKEKSIMFDRFFLSCTYSREISSYFINSQDIDGNTPLHIASFSHNISAIKTLILSCPGLLIKNNKSKLPDQVTSSTDTKDLFINEKKLLEGSILEYAKEISRKTVLPSKSELSSPKSSLLLKLPPKLPSLVIKLRKKKKVPSLLRLNLFSIPGSSLSEFAYGSYGDNYLTLAMRKGDFETVVYLLKRGISPLCSDYKRENAMHFAINIENIKNVEALLNAREEWFKNSLAALSVHNIDGLNPIHLATKNGNLEMVEYMMDIVDCYDRKKESIHQRDRDGNTLLLIAAKYNKPDLFEYFFRKEMSIEETSYNSSTCLHYAVSNKSIRLAKIILSYDADYGRLKQAMNIRMEKPSAIDDGNLINGNMSIWDAIQQFEMKRLVDIIDNGDYSVDDQTYFLKNTPLHVAILTGNVSAMKILRNSNCSINIKNAKGLTAVDLLHKLKEINPSAYNESIRLLKERTLNMSTTNVLASVAFTDDKNEPIIVSRVGELNKNVSNQNVVSYDY